jgi:D-serine deaminase-like pyridoxal phosphate-dependent protein
MDRTQLSKGIIGYSKISMFVLATVISINEDYIIIGLDNNIN